MGNVIKFEIDTDANYTHEEKEGLLENFLAFMQEEDPDVIEGTESVSIVDSNIAGNVQSKDEIIAEFLEKATLTTTAILAADGETLKMVSREI